MLLKRRKPPISRVNIAVFIRQFAILVAAGIPIIRACEMLAASQPNPSLAELIQQIRRDLLTGIPLSSCLQQHPTHIEPLICRLIQISEQTGKLDYMLQLIAEQLEKKLALHAKIKQALFYPCIVAVFGMLVTLLMLLYIVPRFAELFQDFSGTLPAFTRGIFALSAFTRQSCWLIVMLTGAIIGLTILSPARTHQLTQSLKRIVAPLLRHHQHKLLLARFTRYLAVTLTAGIPISDALMLTAQACGNTNFTAIINHVSRHVRTGNLLHRALEQSPLFPPLLLQMVKTGEEAGQLEQMLAKTADMLEAEIERLLSRLSTLLEPLIMLVLGVLIGGMAIGMYLPIFKLGSVI